MIAFFDKWLYERKRFHKVEKEYLGDVMKIRTAHPILDRLKVIVILCLLLFILWQLATVMQKENSQKKTATIEKMLKTALEPIGSTMYIWGGGWNVADDDSGAGSTRIGISLQWKAFANQQDESFNFEEHRFERENGLDCSGYVGWVLYNTFEEENNQPGYVTLSTDLAESLANRGWGKLIHNPKTFLPGDVVSMEGHVWICLGTCADGSVLLAHSSPPGVSICGTSVPKQSTEAQAESMAQTLATEFMSTYYSDWQKKYPNRAVSNVFLENVSVFRWSESIMTDAKEMQELSAEEIIYVIIK